MIQTITIQLPQSMFERLKQIADLAHQPVEQVVEQGLSHILPPLLDEIPASYQADVYPLLAMNDVELQTEAARRFPAKLWQEYERLLIKKKEDVLTEAEHATLHKLRHQTDLLEFRKAYATVLLKRRGYGPSNPVQVSQN
jgi:hypothetical protein